MANVEHGKRLINTDDLAALETLRHRPSHPTSTRRQVKNQFITFENEHFGEFLGEFSAYLRAAPIKLCGVLRVMEMSFGPVAMAMLVTMFVTVAMLVVMSVLVIMGVLMPVFVIVFMSMTTFVAAPRIMLVAVIMTMRVVVIVLLFVIMLVFVFMFVAHRFIIPSSRFTCANNMQVSEILQPI
jgi:hypothetical protein